MNDETPAAHALLQPAIENIAEQVMRNCRISDAKHAGLFSICGLALRLRDLYKWENRLPVWEERDSSEILEWIGEKEESWETASTLEFSRLSLPGGTFDPFDTATINQVLFPYGVFYGAGYARGLKPTFFLAAVESTSRINGIEVVGVGKEFARDLLTLPALNQDDAVVFRREAAELYLWDQILYINTSGKPALAFALETLGLDPEDSQMLRRFLPEILDGYKDAFIYHEIGEIQDRGVDRTIWREMIATYPKTPVELLARTLKDLLADTCPQGTLHHLIQRRQKTALGLYVAFFSGLAKEIFPELRNAFGDFLTSGDWQRMENTVSTAYEHAKSHADLMVEIYQNGKKRNDTEWARKEMEARMLNRLHHGRAANDTVR